MNKQRMTYHTLVKQLYIAGLLPKYLEKQIPRTTKHNWNHINLDNFFGADLNKEAMQHANQLRTIAEFPRVLKAVNKCVKTYTSILSAHKNFKSIIKKSKDVIVNTIIDVKNVIPINKAVEIFNISRSTFQSWYLDVKAKCSKSYFNICNRHMPNQLTFNEVLKIKKLLASTKLKFWPIRSVQAYAVREGILNASLGTFYKYNNLLNVRPLRKDKPKIKPKYNPVITTKPNEKWHADITIYKTLDGIKHCIYLVIDNFSRMIIAYDISKKTSSKIALQNLKDAYKKALNISVIDKVDLIVDGGKENNNQYVEGFINRAHIHIEKLVALKQIDHSNSAVEAVNKTIKYQYLFPEPCQDSDELLEKLPIFIHDYNEIRPHGRLFYQTPYEAFTGIVVDKEKMRLDTEKALVKRLETNKNNTCSQCLTII